MACLIAVIAGSNRAEMDSVVLELLTLILAYLFSIILLAACLFYNGFLILFSTS
jgi:hypothetical protein